MNVEKLYDKKMISIIFTISIIYSLAVGVYVSANQTVDYEIYGVQKQWIQDEALYMKVDDVVLKYNHDTESMYWARTGETTYLYFAEDDELYKEGNIIVAKWVENPITNLHIDRLYTLDEFFEGA